MDVYQRFKRLQIQLDLCSSREQYEQIMRIINAQRGKLGPEMMAELQEQAKEVERWLEA